MESQQKQRILREDFKYKISTYPSIFQLKIERYHRRTPSEYKLSSSAHFFHVRNNLPPLNGGKANTSTQSPALRLCYRHRPMPSPWADAMDTDDNVTFRLLGYRRRKNHLNNTGFSAACFLISTSNRVKIQVERRILSEVVLTNNINLKNKTPNPKTIFFIQCKKLREMTHLIDT